MDKDNTTAYQYTRRLLEARNLFKLLHDQAGGEHRTLALGLVALSDALLAPVAYAAGKMASADTVFAKLPPLPDAVYEKTQAPEAGRDPRLLHKALLEFVEAIDVTGGVEQNTAGVVTGCVADPDWLDLAQVYEAACEALGRKPTIVKND